MRKCTAAQCHTLCARRITVVSANDKVVSSNRFTISESAERNLPRHLEERYGIRVASSIRLQEWSPCVHRIDRKEGGSWVARLFPPARLLERVEGDAEILNYLAVHGYPAEAVAHPEPVSVLEGHGVLVTEFIAGMMVEDVPLSSGGREQTDNVNADGTARQIETERLLRTLGMMLGRIHTLPVIEGVISRDAGSWHSHPPDEGLPAEDLRCAGKLLDGVSNLVDSRYRSRYESLREQVDDADDCGELPRTFVHPDFGGPNIIVSPLGQPVVIDWAGSGKGPRLTSFGWFVNRFTDPYHLKLVVEGYRSQVELTSVELGRLNNAMKILPLYFACRSFYYAVTTGKSPDSGFAGGFCTEADNERRTEIASRLRGYYEAGEPLRV